MILLDKYYKIIKWGVFIVFFVSFVLIVMLGKVYGW